MKQFLFALILFSISTKSNAQTLYFPPLTGNTWDTLSPISLGWCPDKIDTLLDYLEDKNSKAFILLKDGKIVIEKYYGTFMRDSLWYWASAGKTLTAFMVGIAQQENYLSISDTTSQYLGQGWTNCSPSEEEKITIRHQLTMTSGLDDGGDPYCTIDTCLNYLADPGNRWAYHNAPYTLLDGVIENATGQTLNVYTNQKLKIPTGIDGAFIASGFNNVYISKPRGMARFGLLILNKGNWDGNQILTDTNYFSQMVNTSQSLNNSYGYLWWLNGKSNYMLPGLQFVFNGSMNPSAPNDMIAALGKNGQFINVVPSQNLVYIRMGNAPDGGEVPAAINDTIWQKLNDVMCNATSTKEIENDFSQLKIYPNPAANVSTIELQGASFDLFVYDVTARLIYHKSNCTDKAELNTTNYESGIYSIRIQTEGQRVLNGNLIISK
ncbi:MAG: serine hydrolase [Bacteroidia bacterium]|nr:serine hydrolase [Bacteroidia bacterium]